MAGKTTLGIYSSQQKSYIGSGMTKRKVMSKRYWLAEQDEDGEFFVTPVNNNMVPTGRAKAVSEKDFAAEFTHEKDFFVKGDSPVWRHGAEDENEGEAIGISLDDDDEGMGIGISLDDDDDDPMGLGLDDDGPIGIDLTEDELEGGIGIDLDDDVVVGETVAGIDLEEAAPEVSGGFGIDLGDDDEGIVLDDADFDAGEQDELERDTRADFGVGLTMLKRGDRDKAKELFEELAVREGNYTQQHKHMFSDFGTGLRKSRLLETSLKHHNRALALHPDDENIYYNIARVQYEQGDLDGAEESLRASLKLNPNLKESRQFLDWLRKKSRRKGGGKKGGGKSFSLDI